MALAWMQVSFFCIFTASLFTPPPFIPFLIRISVSFVSISKHPTPLGLWGTTHTATLPTTTTDWEGAKAPTAGQRYDY